MKNTKIAQKPLITVSVTRLYTGRSAGKKGVKICVVNWDPEYS
jgi:hypothetical protein